MRFGELRESINQLWAVLGERLHLKRLSSWCSFRVKVLLTTVTICLLVFSAIGFTVLFHGGAACRRAAAGDHHSHRAVVVVVVKRSRSTPKSSVHHQRSTLSPTTRRRSKIIEAITTSARGHQRNFFTTRRVPPRSPKSIIGVLRLGTTTSTTTKQPDFEKNAGSLLFSFSSALFQNQQKLTDRLLSASASASSSYSSSSSNPCPLSSSPPPPPSPSFLCKLFFGAPTIILATSTTTTTSDDLREKKGHSKKPRTSNPWVRGLPTTTTTKRSRNRDPHVDTFDVPNTTTTTKRLGILGFTPTTTTTTTTAPTASPNKKVSKYCQLICSTDPSQGGTLCHCDEPPMYEVRLSPSPSTTIDENR